LAFKSDIEFFDSLAKIAEVHSTTAKIHIQPPTVKTFNVTLSNIPDCETTPAELWLTNALPDKHWEIDRTPPKDAKISITFSFKDEVDAMAFKRHWGGV
jgi:hypothetical protein